MKRAAQQPVWTLIPGAPSEFRAGELGVVRYDATRDRWRWTVLDRHGESEQVGEALAVAQAALIEALSPVAARYSA